MRLLTLRVTDFRGITACEVAFAPVGVSIVEGPNEAGKSSLAFALDLLLEKLDSTKDRQVKAVQPAGRDVGPEVEITAESGVYAFRYRKRFLKRPQTELHVTRPSPETVTGREAHDRVRAILGETMDLDLWRALRIEQGSEVHQPELEGVPSLMKALEQAAGGDGDAGDDGLLERAAQEYEQFFTAKRGQETKRLKGARAERAEAAEAVAALQREHDELERDAERRDELERRAAALREECARAAADRSAAQTAVREIETLRHAVDKLEPAVEEVRTRLKQVQKEHQERQDLARERDGAAQLLEELARDGAGAVQRAGTATEALAAADHAYEESRRALAAAEAALEIRGADEGFRREEAERDDLRARKTELARTDAELVEARGALTGNPVDEALMARLDEAAVAVETRRAALEAGAPSVEIEAIEKLELTLDGDDATLAEGAVERRIVETRLEVTLPGRLRVSVEAGGGARERKRDYEDARHALGRLLAEAGAESLDAARARHRERRAAAAAVAAAENRRRELAAGLSGDALDRRLAALEERVGAYFAGRPSDPPIAGDLETAVAAREEASAEVRRLRERTTAAETERDTRRREDAAAREALREHEDRRRDADKTRAAAEARLAALREKAPDEALARSLTAVKKEQMEREQEFYDRRAELADLDPDGARAALERETARERRTADELRDAKDELLRLGERLQLRGEDGLFDRLEAARQREARARRAEAHLTRRAAAARMLYETLAEEREKTRRRYRSPLRAEIETLGREIFGSGFEVELDDDLRITRRVLGGLALPLEALSMGAREQLSVITRLACARMVGSAEGVPLILDDALGYSDPGRLEAMARVLEIAGASSQIIVLTCYGERYRGVKGARLIPFAAGG